jgi:hypothetical protein
MKNITQPEIEQRHFELTFASGSALSGGAGIYLVAVGAIEMPSAFDGAVLTMQASLDGAVWQDIYDQYGTEMSIAVAPDRTVALMPVDLWPFRFVRFRSGTSAVPVTQSADRILRIACR